MDSFCLLLKSETDNVGFYELMYKNNENIEPHILKTLSFNSRVTSIDALIHSFIMYAQDSIADRIRFRREQTKNIITSIKLVGKFTSLEPDGQTAHR